MPDPRRHGRRYALRFVIAIVLYGVLLTIALLVAPRLEGWARPAMMLLPVPALLAVVWAVWRYLSEVDEMLRQQVITTLALGFGIGSVLTFSYGLMQTAGAPAVSWTLVWPVYAASWLVAWLVTWIRNR